VRSDRWFRRLLRILPLDFRADYGREMEQVFREQRREAAERGMGSVLRVWLQTAAAMVAIGPREHAAQLGQDVRYALRGMRANPGFTAVAVLTLALGIGVNTAIFSIAYAVMLRPLPYHEPDALVSVWNRWDGVPAASLSDPEYLDYSERSRALSIAVTSGAAMNLSGDGAEAERVSGALVTANAFDLLGVGPAIGRAFRSDEERGDGARVVILTHGLWQRRFNGDPLVIGKTLSVNGEVCDIVGVAPRGFLFPFEFGVEDRVQILMPLGLDRAAARNKRGGHYLQPFGRLNPGATLAGARSEMDGIIASLKREYPDQFTQGNFGVALSPLRKDVLGDATPVLAVLAGAVALVLLMACANVASLLLARGEARRRELALRTALGASRFRLVRQMLTEAWLLSGAGAAAGLLVTVWCQRLVVGVAPRALPRVAESSLGGPVLACALVLGVSAGLLFGIIPALQISRTGAAGSLKDGARGTAGRSGARRTLVVAQVSIAVVLLVGAGLLIKSFAKLMSVDSGFTTERVLTLGVALPEPRYPGRPEVTGYFERLLVGMRSLPGVQSAGAASGLPLAVASGDWSFDVEGRPLVNNKHSGAADWYVVTPGFFETLGIRIVRGRGPMPGDTAASQPVLIVNETTARTLFRSEDPIGKRVRFSRSRGFEQPWRTIVGIIADVRQRGLDSPARPEVFFPHAQFQHFSPNAQARAMNVVLKTPADPESLTAMVRDQVRRLDPDVPAAEIRTMDRIVTTSTRDRRLNVILVGAFGALALLLAIVGLYGVMAFQVTQRTREMGVRMALGASRRDVLGLVVRQGLGLVTAGLGAGLVAAAVLSRSIATLLFEVSPRDLSIFAAVSVILFLAGALASYLPARRATRVDPVVALRGDA
jgi:putative ABC transport system permease protein